MSETIKRSLLKWLLCGLLAAVTLAVFMPVVDCPFINLDDPDYVINNLHARQGVTADTVHWAFFAVNNSNWHPLTSLSHALDCQLYGLDPMGHHQTSLIFHTINTALLFLLLFNLTGRMRSSALVALLFGIHPLHVESVTWISERKDVLSGFFLFLTLLAYARYVEVKSQKSEVGSEKPESGGFGASFHPPSAIGCYALSLFFFAFGLMSKPMLVTVPVVLLLLDFWPLQRIHNSKFTIQNLKPLLLEKIPFVILSGFSCWVTILAQNQALKPTADFPLAARLAHVPVAYAWYLFKLVWPVDHSIFYILHVRHPLAEVLGALILLGFVSGLAIWSARRHAYGVVGWLWFVVMLVPVIGLVQAGNQAYAERYTYLPYIGLFIALVWAGDALLQRWPVPKLLTWCAAIMVLAICGHLTMAQVRIWKTAETLFKQAVDQDDKNERAWILYGLQFNRSRQPDRAIECLHRALAINPGNIEAWCSLGRILAQKGEYGESRKALENALLGTELKPVIYKNLADLCLQMGQTQEAIVNLNKSLECQPDQPVVMLALADAYATDHQWDNAARAYENISRSLGANFDAEMGLAMVCGQLNQSVDAVAHYRRAIALEPNSAIALNNLAWLLATEADAHLRNGAEAVRLAKQACDLTRHQEAFLIGTLAAAYAEAGDFSAAVKTAQQARDVALAHGQKDVAANNERLLKTYQAGRAFHEEMKMAP